MKVTDYNDSKFIIFSTAFDNRQKLFYGFYFFNFFVGGTIFLIMPMNNDYGFGLSVFIVIAALAFYIAAYRFINKALEGEKIVVNKTTLTILKSGFLNSKKDTYYLSHISNFRNLDKPKISKHPLAGQSFDYLGFQTEQEVINEMHGDDRLAFDYGDKTIQFGQNIYSWDFEELEILLYDITGNDLRYNDEFEKTFNSKD